MCLHVQLQLRSASFVSYPYQPYTYITGTSISSRHRFCFFADTYRCGSRASPIKAFKASASRLMLHNSDGAMTEILVMVLDVRFLMTLVVNNWQLAQRRNGAYRSQCLLRENSTPREISSCSIQVGRKIDDAGFFSGQQMTRPQATCCQAEQKT